MTADHSSDSGRQRTVAELLAQYGDGGSDGGRRRRRAAGRDADPIETPAGSPAGPSAPAPEAPEPPAPPGGNHVELPRRFSANELFPDTLPPSGPEPGWADYPAGPSALDGSALDTAATPGPPIGLSGWSGVPGPLRRPDQPTEQLPRFRDQDTGATGWVAETPAQVTGPITGSIRSPVGPSMAPELDHGGPPTGRVSPAELFDDSRDVDGPDQTGAPDVPAGLAAEASEPDGAERQSRLRTWAALFGQWVLGAVAGALLWVAFSFLWRNYPVIALVAAVVAIVGLVLLVRAIRRSDDLQTTMLAVLVGVVVTSSPAVLLLAVR